MSIREFLRDESYTGSNRCWPCTLVNVGIVVGIAIAARARNRNTMSVLTALVGLTAVYLRGYLLPYTPRFAPRLVAASPIPDTWFHRPTDREAADSLADGIERDGEDVVQQLVAAGIVVADGEQLYLDTEFETAWHDRMEALAADSLDSLAATLQAGLPQGEPVEPFADAGKQWVALGSATGRLLPRQRAVAEFAAYELIREELGTVEPEPALAGAGALLMFLENCPVCGTELVESSTVSCCGGHSGPQQRPGETLVCPACEQRIYTFDAV